MIEVVVVCHEDLAYKLLEVAERLSHRSEKCWPVSISDGKHPDTYLELIDKAVKEASSGGNPVLILTDLFGGTACNVSLPYLKKGEVEVLSGVNLAMILRAFQRRKQQPEPTVAQLAFDCAKYASEGIRICSMDVLNFRNFNLEAAANKTNAGKTKKNVSSN
ncbi:MAG: hypothetical protein LBG06_05135 [Deltaproteobacteria bacterium]|jgi:PTS system mannose-specific IIA component|nr:hypothetical protein [Deltaproteobacteria bacterium]